MINYKKHPYYGEMNLDNFFQAGWEIYRKNFGWFFFYSLMAMIILQVVNSYFIGPYMEDIQSITENPELISGLLANLVIMLLSSVLIYTLAGLFLSYLVLNQDEIQEKGHLELFKESVKEYFLPLLGASVISGIILFFGSMLGLLLFIIGALFVAIYLLVVFFPLTAVVIIEKLNPVDAIRRCFRMTHSDFWKTTGLVVTVLVIYLVISLILGVLAMAPFAGDFIDMLKDPMGAENITNNIVNPIQLLITSITNALLLPVFPIFGVLLYLSLKKKEDLENGKADLLEQIAR